MTRHHLKRVVFAAIRGRRGESTDEPMSYRAALIGLIFVFGTLLFFCHQVGMALWSSFLFFLIYYAISTAITRMRAELGSPVHDLHFSGPDTTLVKVLGHSCPQLK